MPGGTPPAIVIYWSYHFFKRTGYATNNFFVLMILNENYYIFATKVTNTKIKNI